MYYVQQFLVTKVTDDNTNKEQFVEMWDINGSGHGAKRRNWGGWSKLREGDVVGVLAEVNVPKGVQCTHWEAAGFDDILIIKGIANDALLTKIKQACDLVNKTMVDGN